MANQPLEIDLGPYSNSTPVDQKKATWRAPRHVYFGPRDPETGDMAEEPVYQHQEYPRLMYRLDAESGKIRAQMVNSSGEQAQLGEGWVKTPGELGYIGAPTLEDTFRMAEEARKFREEKEEEETLVKADAIIRRTEKAKGK